MVSIAPFIPPTPPSSPAPSRFVRHRHAILKEPQPKPDLKQKVKAGVKHAYQKMQTTNELVQFGQIVVAVALLL